MVLSKKLPLDEIGSFQQRRRLGEVSRHQPRHPKLCFAHAVGSVNLTIHKGERVLLDGVSGGGKSTFGALIAGWRLPTGGLLLSEGSTWRRSASQGGAAVCLQPRSISKTTF